MIEDTFVVLALFSYALVHVAFVVVIEIGVILVGIARVTSKTCRSLVASASETAPT